MPDKDQFGIYNKDELSLIKNTFADNDVLLYAVRKVLLQFPLTDPEKNLIKLGVTPEVYAVLKKRILPDIGSEYPLGQLPSLLITLTKNLQEKDAIEMGDLFEAKKLELDYLTQQFEVLKDLDAPQHIKLADMSVIETTPRADTTRSNFIGMTAYLFLLGYIDPSLNMIKVIAGAKEETIDQQEKRLKKDSTQ